MPTVAAILSGRKPVDAGFTGDSTLVSWEALANGDVGEAVQLSSYSDRSIQFTGTFGVGGRVVLEGSNDGVNYVTLTDPQANSISKIAAALEAVQEATVWVRPSVIDGDGDTSINAYLFVRGA